MVHEFNKNGCDIQLPIMRGDVQDSRQHTDTDFIWGIWCETQKETAGKLFAEFILCSECL